jgi:hypothetical protein
VLRQLVLGLVLLDDATLLGQARQLARARVEGILLRAHLVQGHFKLGPRGAQLLLALIGVGGARACVGGSALGFLRGARGFGLAPLGFGFLRGCGAQRFGRFPVARFRSGKSR